MAKKGVVLTCKLEKKSKTPSMQYLVVVPACLI